MSANGRNRGPCRGSPGIRRIKADIRELSVDPSDQYHAAPLEHDMFEWHFTIRGALGTDFAGGVYHGRILLPPEYPFKPPDIVFLTPSGRFECGVKVCLSFSAHHPELWQPAWGIRLILEALISFLPTPADGAIGALDWTAAERRKLAKASATFRCPQCCDAGETCADLLPALRGADAAAPRKGRFHAQIEELKMLQFRSHAEGAPTAVEEKDGAGASAEEEVTESAKRAEEVGGADDAPPAQPDTADATKAAAKPPPVLRQESAPKPMENTTDQALQAAVTSPPAVTPSVSEAPQQRSNDDTTATEPTDGVPRVPPVPEGSAQTTPDVTTNAAPAAATDANAPLVSDSLLNVLIGFFGVFVLVLLQRAQTLVEELNGMDEDAE